MKKTIIAILALSIILASCSGNKTKDGTASGGGGVYNYKNPGLLHDQKAIDNAFADLRNMDKYKGKKINVFQSIQFQDYEIAIEISDPAKPSNIDHYTYTDGKWSAPEPVQLSGGTEGLEDNLTDLDKIAVNKIGDMLKIIDEKAKSVEGAEPCKFIGFNLYVPNQIRQFNVTINGTREKISMTFSSDGALKTK